MSEIPETHALSDSLEEHFEGRRVRSAVFLTYTFEPDFFELYILPVLLPEVQLSPVEATALWQIEDALRSQIDNVAVYYDRRGLVPRERSARLDVRRIPCTVRTGYFHPKVLLAVTEPADLESRDTDRLVVMVTSANLTQAGWWENVEVVHIETVQEGEKCSFRGDLLSLISNIRRHSPPDVSHQALDQVHKFVRGLVQRQHMSGGGVLHPRLFVGQQPLAEWLPPLVPKSADRLSLEVISPYFDETDAKPLIDLIDALKPQEVRVYLPRQADGTAACKRDYYDVVAEIDGAEWAQLPPKLLAFGKGDRLKERSVHAKVYRLFDARAKYEAILAGSVNLTHAAHGHGGNLEAAFLIEAATRSGWWLTPIEHEPRRFMEKSDAEPEPQVMARLAMRYDWIERTAAAYWDDPSPGYPISVTGQGAPLFELELPPRQWVSLDPERSKRLQELLASTSFLLIREPAGEYTILVDESGMACKPSVRHELSVADILKSWSLFTPEQRAAFFEERGAALAEALHELGLDWQPCTGAPESFFDQHAGVFLAFGNLERRLKKAIENGRDREIEYWLVGRQYDSLLTLLDRARAEVGDGDVTGLIREYLMLLCTRQLMDTLRKEHPDLRTRYAAGFAAVAQVVDGLKGVRERFDFDGPEDRARFLAWFENWFLKRATPLEVA